MRDLARALSNIKLFHYDESFVAVCDERYGTLIFQLGLLYEAIERAIKAEDRVDTLQIVAKENYRMYENTLAENIKLRAVVEAAKDHLNTAVGSRAFKQTGIALGYALAELDKEDE